MGLGMRSEFIEFAGEGSGFDCWSSEMARRQWWFDASYCFAVIFLRGFGVIASGVF